MVTHRSKGDEEKADEISAEGGENASTDASSPTSFQEGLNEVMETISARIATAKADYRAAHVELQLCKKQLQETQILVRVYRVCNVFCMVFIALNPNAFSLYYELL